MSDKPSSQALPPSSPPPREGQTLGAYRVVGVLGRGGMGQVFRAVHDTLERHVALKILPPEYTDNPTFVTRFLREARVAATLRHDHIVQVYDAGQVEGRYYIAMELVEGRSLDQLIKEGGALDEARALELLHQAALGLQAAHDKGLVHRDIKPENLLLDEAGKLRIADFGMVMESASGSNLTATGTTIGTPMFMSPEQVDGEAVDARTDIYSLGATFYQALTGHPPYEGKSLANLLYKHKFEAPIDPKSRRADLSDNVCNLILTMMAKEAERRPQSAAAVLDLIRQIRGGEELPSAPPLPPLPAPPSGSPEAGANAATSNARMASNPDAPTMTMQVPTGDAAARDASQSNKRTWIVLAIGAGVGVVLLLVFMVLFNRQIKKQEKTKILTALVNAEEKVEAGDPTAGRTILEAARQEVRPNAPGYPKLLQRLGQLKALEEKEANRQKLTEALDEARLRIALNKAASALELLYQTKEDLPDDTPGLVELAQLIAQAKDAQVAEKVEARFVDFALALVNKRFDEALRMVAPASRKKHGDPGIELRLKILGGMAKFAQVTRDKVKVKDVHFSEDYTRATLTPQFQVGLEWKTAKASEWALIDEQWYVVVE